MWSTQAERDNVGVHDKLMSVRRLYAFFMFRTLLRVLF